MIFFQAESSFVFISNEEGKLGERSWSCLGLSRCYQMSGRPHLQLLEEAWQGPYIYQKFV
jgi:hypothetical protein